jgi:hypothetical protein
MLYQLSYASPSGSPAHRAKTAPPLRETAPETSKYADTLPLRAFHGTEDKVSTSGGAGATGAAHEFSAAPVQILRPAFLNFYPPNPADLAWPIWLDIPLGPGGTCLCRILSGN